MMNGCVATEATQCKTCEIMCVCLTVALLLLSVIRTGLASSGLESDMRKGIFLADPRDVDSMLSVAHEVHGRRRLPPPGW